MTDFLPFTRPDLDEAAISAVVGVLRSGWLASGPKVLEFEAALSAYLSDRPVRVLNHATAGLEIALRVCGIGPGDEVITPALSFVATANVIALVGARPVFVDVDLDTRNLDLDQVEAAITPRTRAIMPVHFAGLPIDLDRTLAIAKRHGLRVIEDAAHAIGTEWGGRRIGSFGDLAVFSFHPNKNMTTIEGGAIAGGSPEEVAAIERLRFHGLKRTAPDTFEVLEPSGKANMPDVSACIGLAQLPRLRQFNETRRALAGLYFEHWEKNAPVRLPARGDSGHAWHMFAPLVPVGTRKVNRAAFLKAMEKRKIGVGVHYQAIHLFAAYRAMGYRDGQFPNAERVGRETVTLPLFPAMSAQDVDRVVQAVEPALSEAVS